MAQTAASLKDNSSAEKIRGKLGDPKWRLNNLYWITNKKGKRVKFKMNHVQQLLYSNMWFLTLILKGRQLGMTTLIQIFILDRCLFTSNVRAGVIAHNREDAQKFFHDKFKFPYDNLPDWLRAEISATSNGVSKMAFSNGSSVSVGTSMRSGTLQYLHVSEFGKICAKHPQKAKEIVTGAFNAVDAGQFLFVESTAEGNEGYFFDFCETAKNLKLEERELTPLDFKFFFFPWHDEPSYRLNGNIVITGADDKYFYELEHNHSIKLVQAQKNWYVKKKETQGSNMKREFPSTPEEAFEQSIDGAYFSTEMAKVREEGRICDIPYLNQFPVHVFFDLGRHEPTAMWFMQDYYGAFRFIAYYESSDESIQHYIKYMQNQGYVYGDIYLPHDGDVTDYSSADNKTRADIIRAAGFRVDVVLKVPAKIEGIQAIRDVLPRCHFDQKKAAAGIKMLDSHRKEWDDKYGRWRDRAFHGPACHGVDAFEQFARGYSDTSRYQKSFNPTDDDY